jgi:hypothetical protein
MLLYSNDDSSMVSNFLVLLKLAPLILLNRNENLPTVVSSGRPLKSMTEVSAEYDTSFSKAYSEMVTSLLQFVNLIKVAFEYLKALTPMVVSDTKPDKSMLVILPLLLLKKAS